MMDEPGEGEGVKQLEEHLKAELLELRNEIEENDLVHGIPSKGMSSLHIPRDVEYFRRERRLAIQRSLQVSEVAPLFCQADVMRRELSTCDPAEYSVKSLLLMTHQYFVDRMHSLVVSKHSHMLRWKRFSVHSGIIESSYTDYKNRVQHIMDEYLDCSARAHRLATAKEGFLMSNDSGLEEINNEDVLIFMRWLVTHLHSLRLYMQVARMIQWFPVAHKNDITPEIKTYKEKPENMNFVRPSAAAPAGLEAFESRRRGQDSSTSDSASSETSVPMPPAMISAAMLGANPLSPTSFNFAMAAAGGGIATDEKSLCLPLHFNDLRLLRPHLAILCNVYTINFDVDNIRTSADEMELYANINRKFRHIFMHQEVMKTLRTYDRSELAKDKWGFDTCNHALLKEANWLDYAHLVPKQELGTVRNMTRMRVQNNIDELLRVCSGFLKLQDPDKVQDALRHHALLIQNPPVVHASAVVNHRTGQATAEVWKKIYANPDLYMESGGGGNLDEEGQGAASGKLHRRRSSYDFEATMAMLGLEETDKNQDDPSSVQGAYLSFLHLRHLKIRDVQRSCLSFLNYFRSIQRTLVINDEGLSLDGGPVDRSPQNHRSGREYSGHQGGGGTIGAHGYLFNSPREFKVNELEFMQFSEVENHDDFYFHEEGRLHVRDQIGYYIVYDVAMRDFEKLEKDLMYVGTHFIEKDTELRNASIFKRKRTRADDGAENEGDFDISQYAHKEVDRFGVLYDLWCSECAFLECKAELMDVYLECYHNVADREERRRLAQVITNLSFQQPRIDFKDKYFLLAYRLECAVLRLKRDFVKRLLDRQIEEQREYLDRVWGNMLTPATSPIDTYGLPHSFIAKCPIAVHSDECSLRTAYLLEFHPSLSIAGRIGDAIERSYLDLVNIHRPASVLEEVQLEKRMCEVLLLELQEMDPMGASYSQNIQRDLFNGMYFEDPNHVVAVARQVLIDLDASRQRGDKKTRTRAVLTQLGRILDLVTTRFRLMDTGFETAVLSRVYRHLAHEMGYDDFHLYMRYIQFESAKKKAGAEAARPPLYITSIQEDDSLLDKYAPSTLPLAISEMDETHLGRFSFRDRDFVLQMLRGSGDKNLHSVLKLQLTHRNALVAAVMLAHNCLRDIDAAADRRGESAAGEKSEKSTLTGMSVLSRASGALSSPLMPSRQQQSRYDPEAFFSVQLEKTPSRDRIMNEFIVKTSSCSAILKNQAELTNLKRTLVSHFCDDFGERTAQASLRAQLIAYYNSIVLSLSKMPNLSKHYFVLGEASDKKGPEDNVSALDPDPRLIKNRPRRLLSEDGERFLNLWFLPHYREVLMLFKAQDDAHCTRALRRCLRIVGPLHDILQYLFAHARLGTSAARLGTGAASEFVTTDWGGTEGIGTVLREIQRQIDALHDPGNPDDVAEMLLLRRQAMFLEFDVCVRHVLRETFLASGNVQAYQSVTENMHFPLAELSDAQRPSFLAVELPVPEPLEARDVAAKELYPWRAFVNDSGVFPLMYPPWYRIEFNLQLCLAGLRDVDRPVVHGELLALSLSLEDVLRHGMVSETAAGDVIQFAEAGDYSDILLLGKRMTSEKVKSSRPVSRQDEADTSESQNSTLSTVGNSKVAYRLVCRFLVLWKRLDALKYEWGRRRLGVERIDTVSKYKNFCKLYKSERLFHIMRSLAIQYGQGLLYDHGPLADTDMYVTPANVPEMVVKQRQLSRLVESLECAFIADVRRRIVRHLDLVLKERNREEGNLPTDLWKRPAMKETFSMRRATIAEDFIHELMSNAEETDSSITFSLEHLNRCLFNLASTVMASQKEIYENYSMYYENLLRHHHHLLYEREREVLEVREMLKAREMSTTVDVQFQLADQAHSLILEVTALRAKVAEMRENSLTMEGNIRDAVRQEYNDMVHSLFSVAFEQKARIDEYRQHLHTTTLARIAEVRSEAAVEMSKVKERSGAKPTADDELSKRNLRLSQRMSKIEQYNINLHQLMSRMKCMFTWRQSYAKCDYMRKVAELQNEKNNNQKSKTRLEMFSREKFHLMMEELNQVKAYLTNTEKELNQLRRKLDKELREKMEKQHASERKAASDKQLANVKQMHIDKLMDEIQEKDRILAEMRSDLDKNLKTQQTTVDKTYKEVDSLKKMLREERKLKQNAFHKVDDLLSQVYEYETAFTVSRGPGTAGAGSLGQSRPTSTNRSRASSRPSTAIWPPAVVHPPKSLTPELRVAHHDTRVRPKTVSGQRLRSRIAEQLLYNVEPDHHDTLVKLERQQQAAKKEEQRV